MLIRMLTTIFAAAVLSLSSSTNPIAADGSYKGKVLQGKVKIVSYGETFKVKVVENFPHLKVQLVEHFPDKVGKWQIVDHGEDFRVRFVEYGEDFRISFVEHFPGVRN